MPTTSELLSAALSLRGEERAELAHKLLLSLELIEPGEHIDDAWASEIRRRLQAIREGRTELRDWNEALIEIRQLLVPQGRP